MLNLMDENRIELLAAVAGAALGIVGGYLSGNDWFIMATWAVVFAIVASEGVSGFSIAAYVYFEDEPGRRSAAKLLTVTQTWNANEFR